MKKKILFIINPISGVRKAEKKQLPDTIKENLDHSKYDYSITYTEFKGHAIDITKEAIENNIDIIVAVGGDGSINEIASCLVATQIVFAIIPFGSGNGLARHLGISLNSKLAVQTINQFNVKPIDTAEYFPGRFFFSNIGTGFAADVILRFSNFKIRGMLGYAMAVIKGMFVSDPVPVCFSIDGKEVNEEVVSFNIFNGSEFGMGVSLAHFAKTDDGLLNITVMKKFPRWMFPYVGTLILTGKAHWIPGMKYYEATSFKVINKRKEDVLLQVDGEWHYFKEDWEVKIHPASLNVLMP